MSNLDPGPADFAALPSCGDFDFRIARDGTWFYRGSPIGRKPLVKLFASVLRQEDDGSYWLVTPVERGRITVEDAPFVAVELNAEGKGREQRLVFRTNVDDEVVADASHPIRVAYETTGGAPRPYLLVRGRLEALIARPVFYQLVELAEPMGDGSGLGVWSGGTFFPLGRVSEN